MLESIDQIITRAIELLKSGGAVGACSDVPRNGFPVSSAKHADSKGA
jgi:hypothetical protein